MHRVIVSLMCLLSITLAGSVFGQDADKPQSDPGPAAPAKTSGSDSGVVAYDSYSGGATQGTGTYFNARFMSGSGVGYQGGYYQFGGFRPFWLDDNTFIAPDLRLLLTNNAQVGGNFGGVARRYFDGYDRIGGVYGYFDTDSQSNHRYNQGSLGAETLGAWDFRANGYFPTGTQDNVVANGAPLCVMGDPMVQGHSVVFNGIQGQTRAQALQGGDFEFGIPVAPQWQWLRINAGAYYYRSSQVQPVAVDKPIPGQAPADAWGFRSRLDAWLTDDLLASVNVTTDPIWGTNVNAVVDFRFSGFKPTRWYPDYTTRERMLTAVQRNWRVAVEQYGTDFSTPVAGVNPTTGKPYFIEFINNTAAAGGDGSFEHPFNSFNHPAGLPNADIILVAKGNSTLANPYIGTMTLFDNQRLLGEGASDIAPIALSASFGGCSVSGNFDLPGTNPNSGNNPFVTNGGGTTPLVTLANNNEVAGFNMVNSGGDGVFGNGIRDFNLHGLEITGNAGRGIALQGVSGSTTTISNINIGVADYANPNGYGNNAGGGILVTAGPGSLGNLQLNNVNMNSNPAGTSPFGISLAADQGSLMTTLTNVNVNGNGTGLKLEETNHSLVAALNGVTANGNVVDGVNITGNGGDVTVNSNNSATPLIANGNGGTGILYTQTGGVGQVNLKGAQANGNGLDGIALISSAGANTTTNIVDGQFNDNARDGIHHTANGANGVLNVDPTQILRNGRDGYFFNLTGGAVWTDTFLNDTLNNNARSAFYGSMNNATMTLTATNTTGTTSGANGFHLDAAAGSVFNSTLTNVNLSGSGLSGIDVQLLSNSSATIAATNSLINNNAQRGVFVSGSGLSNFIGTFDSTGINGNGGNGVQINLDNSPNSSLALTGSTTLTGNGGNGLLINASTNTSITPTLTGTVIQNNTLDGIRLNVLSGSNVGSGTITNALITDNLANGVEVNINGAGSKSDLAFSNTKITNSAGIAPQLDGLLFDVTGGGQFVANFANGSALNNNGQNAVNGTVAGTGAAGSSSATILLDGVNAGGSGFSNVVLSASQGGLLNFTTQNGTSLSNSAGGAGLKVTVANLNTVANLELDSTTMNNNQTVGLDATVTNTIVPVGAQQGATLNVCLDNSSASFNQLQGLLLNVTGPGAVANYGVGNTTVGSASNINGNGQEGLLANAINQGTINYRSIGSHYDNNGSTGVFDGINIGTDNSNIRALFSGGSANNNTGDGLRVGAAPPAANTNGSNITLSLSDAFTSSGNGGYALNFDVASANSAYLLIDPVSPPVLNGLINLNYANVNEAFVNLTGHFHFDGMAGSGLSANFSGANTVVFSIDGLGDSTADNNTLDGLDINLSNVTNGSVLVKGFSSISGNGGDGIHVSMNNVTTGALELQGVAGGTALAGNGGNGINTQLTNVNLVNNFSASLSATIIGLTKTDNQSFNSCIPLAVPLSVDFGNTVPTKALTVDNFTVSDSGLAGIIVDGTNAKVATNGGSISNDTVTNSQSGDGIRLTLNDAAGSTANQFKFNNNSSTGNLGGDGIKINLTNVAMDNSQFQNLTGSNNSGNGINIGLTTSSMNNADLTGAIAASGNGLDGLHIALSGSSMTPTTGPTSVVANSNGGNGVFIDSAAASNIFLDMKSLNANTNALVGFKGNAVGGSQLNISADAGALTNNTLQGLDLTVTGAGSGSLFNVNAMTVTGNLQQGLLATVSAGGNLDYRSVNTVYNNNGVATAQDGVDMRVNGAASTLLSLFDGGSASGNGRDGYHFGGLTDGGTINGATLTASLNNGVSSTGNARDALNFGALNGSKANLLMSSAAPTAVMTGPINLDFTGVTQTAIANLTGAFTLNGGPADGLTAKFTAANTAIFNLNGLGASTADGNANNGLNVTMSGVTNGSVQVAGFSSLSNNVAGDGIHVGMTNVANGALSLQGIGIGTALAGNGGNGLITQLNNVNLINNFSGVVAAPTVSFLTTVDNQPAPYAVLPIPVTGPLSLAGMTPTTGLTVNGFTATNNALGGVLVDGVKTTVGDGGSMSGNTATGSVNGDGVRLTLNDSALVGATANNFLFNNNTATGNSGDGVKIDLNKVAMDNSQFQNIIGSTNGGNGVTINLLNSSMDNLALTTIAASSNTLDGLHLNLDGSSMTPTTGPTSVVASTNGGNGVFINSVNASNIFLDMQTLTANNNTLAGFNGTALTGSQLNISLDNPSSLQNNLQQGLILNINGAGSSSLFNVNTLTDFNNALQGLQATVAAGGNLDYRSVNSTYDNNGATTAQDGVDMRVNGATSTLLTLFDGGSANGNGRDGFHFGGLVDGGTLGGATLTASLNNGVTSSSNVRYALNFDALNGGAANLLLDSVTPPVLTGPVNLDFSGVTGTAVANLSGTFHFDGGTGNGLTANFNGANTAILNLDGKGTSTADGNAGNGILVNMTNVTNGAIQIAGFTSMSNNVAGDGIQINMTNVTNGALSLQGVAGDTALNGNGGNGINAQLNTVNLINNFSGVVTNPMVTYLTTVDNQPAPYGVLPLPVTSVLNLSGLPPATGLTVNGFTADSSGLGGIIVDGTDVAIADGGSMSGNTVTNSVNGDGIRLTLNDAALSNANNFLFNNNSSAGNVAGDGINVALTNVSMNNAQFQTLNGSNNSGTGINLVATNGSMTGGTFTNWTGSNNAATGINVDVTNGNLDNSQFLGLTALSNTGGDGINVALTNVSMNNAQIQNLTGSNNSGTGINLVTTGGSMTGGTFTNWTGSNNAAAGINVDVTNGNLDNSQFNGLTASNNTGGDGIDLTLTGTTMDTAKLQNLTASSNTAGNGINITLLNSSMNDLDMTGAITASTNLLDGLAISLDNSSVTPTTGPTSVVASSNGGNGVIISAVNASNIFLDAASLTANGNALVGFSGSALSGSTLNVCLDNPSSLSNNVLQGLSITVSGAGSVSNFNVDTLTANGNTQQGLLATVDAGGVLNYRSVASTYDNNGTAALQDGVDMRVDGATSILRALFDGGSAKNNGRDGYHFGGLTDGSSVNGASVTVGLQNVATASGNTRFALNFDVPNASSANLLMDNTVAMTGTSNVNVNGATNEVVLQLAGVSFNGNAGDGLNLVFDNGVTGITSAYVSMDGLGTATIDGNVGNGVSITMNGLTSGSVDIKNYASISTNGLDGVLISMTNVASGAIEVAGPAGLTTMSNNGHNAVDVQLSGTSLVDNIAGVAVLPTVTGLTTTDNQASPLNCLPLPVTLTYNTVFPATALNISNLDITGSGATGGTGGITVVGTDSNIAANSGFITGNTVTDSANGDGIAVLMTNTVLPTLPTINGLTIDDNTVGTLLLPNTGDGIRVDVTNAVDPNGSTADDVKITNNTVIGNGGDGIEFRITNPVGSTSTANNLTIDTNTVTDNGGNGLVVALSDVQMSPVSISGNSFSTNALDGMFLNLLNATVDTLTTTNNIVDNNSGNGVNVVLNGSTITNWTDPGSISGNDLNGLLITASNTSSVTNATFTNVAIDNNGLDGVKFVTTDATTSTFGTALAPISFIGGSISNNGRLAPGNGVNLTTLANGSIANLIFTNETIGNTAPGGTQQNGLVYAVAATGGTANASFTGGTISNNAIDAINGTITGTGTAGGSSSTIMLTGTTADGSGSIGALFDVTAAGSLVLTVQDDAGTASSISGSGGDGIQITAADAGTLITTTITNSTVSNNGATVAGNGLTATFDNDAVGTFTIAGSTIGNTAPGGTQLDGILLNLNQTIATGLTDVTLNATSTDLSNNTGSALEAFVTGAAAVATNGAHITFDGVTADASGGLGVALNANTGALINFTAQNLSSISGSGQDGIFVGATDANTLVSVLLTDTVVNNNGTAIFPGDGLNASVLNGANFVLEAATTGLGPASFSGNTGDGIDILVSDVGSRADIDLHQAIVGSDVTNAFTGNTLNGLKFQSFDGGEVNVQAYKSTFDTNGGAGLLGSVTNALGVNTVGRIRIVGGEANDNSGDGFSLSANNTTAGPTGLSTLTAMFQADDANVGVSAQNNGGIGLDFVTNSTVASTPTAGTVGNLLMTGPSILNGNGVKAVNVSMNNSLQAIVGLSGTFDNGLGDGIGISLTNISGLALVALQGPGEVKNNAGNGINVALTNVHSGGVFIGGFTDVSNNGTANGAGGLGQDGIRVNMNNVGADFGSGTGFGALSINGSTTAVPGNTMNVSNNTGNGINININTGSIIDNTQFSAGLGSNLVDVIVNNGDVNPATNLIPPPPLPVVPQIASALPMLDVQSQNVTNILGITFGPTTSIENVALDANGSDAVAAGKGILFTVDGSSVAGSTLLQNDTITNTGTGGFANQGIQLNLLNAAVVTGMDIVDSSITGSRGDGFQMRNPYFTNTNPTPNSFALKFTRDTITGNNGNGVNIALPNSTNLVSRSPVLDLTFTNSTVSSNTLNGLLVDVANVANSLAVANVKFLSDSVTANAVSGLFNNQFNNNTGMGALLASTDTFATNQGNINLTVGGTGNQNQFNGDGDAGIGFALAGSAHGTATVSNATFNNTVFANTHGANFLGDGFAVFLRGTAAAPPTATFDGATLGDAALNNTSFSGNAGSGIRVTTSLNGSVNLSGATTMTIQHSTINGNAGNGITFLRNAGVVTPGPYIRNVVIDNNVITNNQRGIDLLSEFADGFDTYSISNNTISTNRSHGIALFTEADADIQVQTDNNQINGNGGDGIHGTQNLGPTDVGMMQLSVTNSTITTNTLNGINITAVQQVIIGTTGNGNTISNNTQDGIFLNGASIPFTQDQIVENQISNNGNNGVRINAIGSLSVLIQDNNNLITVPGGGLGGINANGNDGIQLNAVQGRLIATVDNNDVLGSVAGDGIQLLVSNTGTVLANTANITNNDVEDSGRRGINILNAATNRTNLTITSNVVARSQLEGVYIVNTSTTGAIGNTVGGVQGIDELATTTMATADTWTNDPRLALHVLNNVITSNGQVGSVASVFDATGLVLRVGSSDANTFPNDGAANSYQNNGGFASNLNSAGLAGAFSVANVVRGGVAANITGNQIQANFSSDVTFQAFNSTNAPPTTAGAWTDQNEGDSTAGPPVPRNPGNDVFRVDSYTQDPLSRLDLRFTNTNFGDAMIATRQDFFTSQNPGFYNNNESVFKSRTNSQDGNDPPVGGGNAANQTVGDDGGPYTNGARFRNITRQATNTGAFNAPSGVGSPVDVATNGFLFSGSSTSSTFRKSNDTSDSGFATTPTDNFGAQVLGIGGAENFKWDTLP